MSIPCRNVLVKYKRCATLYITKDAKGCEYARNRYHGTLLTLVSAPIVYLVAETRPGCRLFSIGLPVPANVLAKPTYSSVRSEAIVRLHVE